MNLNRLTPTRIPTATAQQQLTPIGDLSIANEERRLLYEALYALRHDADDAAVHYADYLLLRVQLTAN